MRKNQEKVWHWVNFVYPCHLSLMYQFPNCSLVGANSSSDTKINEQTYKTVYPRVLNNTCLTENWYRKTEWNILALAFVLELHPSILRSVLLSSDRESWMIPQPQMIEIARTHTGQGFQGFTEYTHTHTHTYHTLMEFTVLTYVPLGLRRETGRFGTCIKRKVDPLFSWWLRWFLWDLRFFFYTPLPCVTPVASSVMLNHIFQVLIESLRYQLEQFNSITLETTIAFNWTSITTHIYN